MVYSYSSIATYKQCPAKFNFAYIERVEVQKQPPSLALERGSKIHDSVEAYFKRETEFLHPDIHSDYGQFMFSIREEHDDVRPEWKWGLTWDFKPCEYDAPNCMIHGFIDLLVVPPSDQMIPLYEWKTGKKYLEPHASQACKYATAVMYHFPDHEGVDAMITYFDQVDYHKIHYPRTMLNDYKFMLRKEINKIVDETRFPPMPSFKCKWCEFSRYNGGPCSVA